MAEASEILEEDNRHYDDRWLIHNPLEHLQLLCPFERQIGIDCCGKITHCSRDAKEKN